MCRSVRVLCVAGDEATLAALRQATVAAEWELTPGAVDETDFRRCLVLLRDAGYAGPLALVHDGPDDDEWGVLDRAYALVTSVFGKGTSPAAGEPSRATTG